MWPNRTVQVFPGTALQPVRRAALPCKLTRNGGRTVLLGTGSDQSATFELRT
jgi:hypothetical protein